MSYGDLAEQNLRLAGALLRQQGELQRVRRRLAALGEDPAPHHRDAKSAAKGPPPCLRPLDQCEHVFHCPACEAGSCAPGDAENGYCGHCGYVGTGQIADRTPTGDLRQRLAKALRAGLRQIPGVRALPSPGGRAEQDARVAAEQATITADRRADRLQDTLHQVRAMIAQYRRLQVAAADDKPIPARNGNAIYADAYAQVVRDFERVAGPAADDVARCRVCGCTEEAACDGGCHWVPDAQGDLCNRCVGAVVRVTVEDLDTGERAVRDVPAGSYALWATEPCSFQVAALPGGFHRILVRNIQDGHSDSHSDGDTSGEAGDDGRR